MWGVSLTHPALASFLCQEILLNILCWLHFYVGSFSYTSHAGFTFPWGVSLTHPMLAFYFILFFYIIWGVSLTHPALASFLCQEFLLNILCWLHFYVGSFSYTSHATFVFMWGVSLTQSMLPSFLCKEFLLHIQCCLDFYARHYTSHAGIVFYIFVLGVFFTHLVLVSFLIGGFSYTSCAGFIFIWEFSFTNPMLTTFFNLGSYTSRVGFIPIWEVSLTHPMLALIWSADFL